MNEPEDLTDLLDDDFDGETRVLPRQQHSYPPVAMTPPKKSDAPIWAGILGATFVFGLAAASVAGFFVWQHHKTSEDSVETTAAAAPATDTPAATATTATTSAPPAATDNLEPLAVATSAPTTTTHAAPVPHGSGVLQTFAIGRGKTIYVDGKAAGVGGQHVKTACGRHTIAVGSAKARTYEVPCNGSSITVGTPDGT